MKQNMQNKYGEQWSDSLAVVAIIVVIVGVVSFWLAGMP